MSLDPFPEHLDAVRLFARDGSVSAILPISRLERLTENLFDNSGQVSVDLHFSHDDERRQLLSGSLQTEVRVLCQRCLQPMQLALECDLELLVLENEEAVAALQGDEALLDAIIMGPEGLDILAVLEDELILGLPLVPVHDDVGCNEALNKLRETVGKAEQGATSPFSVLAAMKPKNGS
jgi:uncharacterized protein